MSLSERLRSTRKAKKLTQLQLSKEAGINQSTLSQLELGLMKTTTQLPALAQALGVDAYWLQTGVGSPDSKKSTIDLTPIQEWDDQTPLDDDEVEIPFFKDFSFACGSGSINEHIANEKRKLRMAKSTLRNLSITKGNAVAATASGDSMSPTIQDGDTIHIDLGRTEIKDGRIFVICIGGLHYAKRLYNAPFGGVRIVSDNVSEYPEITLTAEERIEQEFQIFGWVWQIARIERW